MHFLPMAELLERATAGGYAVPAFTVWSSETMVTVLTVATQLRAPVILMNGPGEFPLIGPGDMGVVAYALAERFDVPAALHLDHGDALEQVEACLQARYTSVMLDFSARPYDENAGALRRVVELARPYGATVEGEIGHVGKVDTVSVEGLGASTLTDPEEAAAYLADTGVDALAISIGNAHGQYTRLPRLDFDRLAILRQAINVPLVLHGGSGTPEADLQRAISLGIAKVNVATELLTSVRQSLMEQWNAGENLWTPLAQAESMKALAAVVERWIRRTGAAGRA
ncbi:MAG: class II fructose-bisphosphate aldolase [Armatimonadota bacterium]